ncbi:MAG: hypothetical protein EA361_00955 [Bacteroidetes bacterium]|nr:MAG: hypothetical protein EA361_00955 [Bacteroidota bacterium]
MKNHRYLITLLLISLLTVSCASDSGQATDETKDTPTPTVIPGTPVSDMDGNTYGTVIIGNLEWMAENLKTTTYSNGEPIDYPGDNKSAWSDNTQGAYAWYDNDASIGDIYGALYNWYAVANPNGLCPAGWRVADQEDWQYLTGFVGDQMGNKLKSRRQVGSPFGGEYDTQEHPRWETFSTNYGTDAYGFGALPAGNRHASGTFVTMGANALFWSSSEVSEEAGFGWYIYHGYYGVDRGYGDKGSGFSVRCVRDAR